MNKKEIIIKCHAHDPRFGDEQIHWRGSDLKNEPYGYPYRTCSYCGCINPHDLVELMKNDSNIKLSRTTKSYKYYVENIPNPQSGKVVEIGSNSENGVTIPIMGVAPKFTVAKLYVNHLSDLGEDKDEILKFLESNL